MAVQQRSRDEALMVGYLLGQLSVAETEQIEERFFLDSAFFEQLLVIEEELVDDYARGALAPEERDRLERHWLISQERRDRVRMATQLIGLLRERPRQNRSLRARWMPLRRPGAAGLPWALAAAALVAISGALWLVPQAFRIRNELVEIRRDRAVLQRERHELQRRLDDARARNDALAEQLRRERENPSPLRSPPQSAAPIVAFVLPPGSTRSGPDQTQLLVPSRAGAVRLQIDLPADAAFRRYRAVLRTPDGSNVWSEDVSPVGSKVESRVLVSIPALVLADGDYILSLHGIMAGGGTETVTSRVFRVVRP